MNLHSIRVRLTAWYFLSLAFILIFFSAGCLVAMRASINRAVDDELRIQIKDVTDFLMGEGRKMARDDMSDELRELSSGGTLLRVLDQQGHTLYQPGFFLQYKVPVLAAGNQQTQYTTFRTRQDVYRMASRWIVAPDRRFLVTAAHSMREFENSLRQFQFVLVLLSLLALALACAGGFFISRRALRPVDAITEAARTLSFNNLSTRLGVPRTNDELQRLS